MAIFTQNNEISGDLVFQSCFNMACHLHILRTKQWTVIINYGGNNWTTELYDIFITITSIHFFQKVSDTPGALFVNAENSPEEVSFQLCEVYDFSEIK